MHSCRITLPKFADIHDRMAVTDRKIGDEFTVTAGVCPGLGRFVAIRIDHGVTLLSETPFKRPGYNARTAIYGNPGSPLADAYAWNCLAARATLSTPAVAPDRLLRLQSLKIEKIQLSY